MAAVNSFVTMNGFWQNGAVGMAPSFPSCAVGCLLHVRKRERKSKVGKMSLLISLSAQEGVGEGKRANEPAQNFLPCGGGGGVILLLQEEGIQLPQRQTFVA